MKFIFCAMFLLLTMSAAAQNTGEFDIRAAQRFANLALVCVHKEYPNHISHTLNSDADAAPPQNPGQAAQAFDSILVLPRPSLRPDRTVNFTHDFLSPLNSSRNHGV